MVRANLEEAALAGGPSDLESLKRHARQALGRFVNERHAPPPDDRPGRDGGLSRRLAPPPPLERRLDAPGISLGVRSADRGASGATTVDPEARSSRIIGGRRSWAGVQEHRPRFDDAADG